MIPDDSQQAEEPTAGATDRSDPDPERKTPDPPRLATESIAGQRPYQEDSVLAQTLPDGRTLVAVADGMGGHAAGEVASALALEVLSRSLQEGQDLAEAFRLANERVHTKAREPGKQGMGTTLVAMLLGEGGYEIANVGDSRGYVLTREGIRRATHDHSFVAEAIKRGQSEEEAKNSQWKDALTRSIGTDPDVSVDVFGPFPVEPDSAVLLCSDGLYKTLADADLREIFTKSSGPRGAAQAMVSAAYERGSDDNITVAIAEFGEVPRDRPVGTMPLEWEPPEEEQEDEAAVEVASETRGQPDAGVPELVAPPRVPAGLVAAAVVVVILAVIAFLIFGR